MRWSKTREPDDRLADVRISLGTKKGLGSYLVFRGDPQDVVQLLKDALDEITPIFNYDDKRGRPQG